MPVPASAAIAYPSEWSDGEWAILAPLLPPAKPGGRARAVNLRVILNGIFHVLRRGCPWRMLPREYGPWSTVYASLRRWRLSGTWEQIHTTLRHRGHRGRRQRGRAPTPSAAILASQSLKTTERGGPHGYDGAKKLSGRKRHRRVDTRGLGLGGLGGLGGVVHPADRQDRASAPWLLHQFQPTLPRMELIWADNAYRGPLQSWGWETVGWRLTGGERPGGRGQWLRADQEPPSASPVFTGSRAAGGWSALSPGSDAPGG